MTTDSTTTDPAATDETTEDTGATVETDDADTTTTDDGGETTDVARLSRENAARRVELKEARTTIATLEQQLSATRQGVVDGIAAGKGVDPRLLVTAGHDLASFLTEDGTVDGAKVAEAVDAVSREFGLRRGPAPNRQQGAPSHPRGGNSWAAAIRGD